VSAIIRKLDQRRRLVIPKETLSAAGFKPGDLLRVWKDVGEDGNPCLLLTLYQPGCALCGSTNVKEGDYIVFNDDKIVCNKCAAKLVEGGK